MCGMPAKKMASQCGIMLVFCVRAARRGPAAAPGAAAAGCAAPAGGAGAPFPSALLLGAAALDAVERPLSLQSIVSNGSATPFVTARELRASVARQTPMR